MTTYYYGSKRNLLKRSTLTGSATIGGPTTPLTPWFNYQNNATVAHNLGFVPLVRVYFDPFNNGTLFRATGTRLNGGYTYTNEIACIVEVNTANLIIHLESFSNLGGSVPIYWVIYLDH